MFCQACNSPLPSSSPFDGYLQTMMFLQLVAGGHLMSFLTRTPGAFWKPPFPASKLFWAKNRTPFLKHLKAVVHSLGALHQH
jgi:hypothetical protein